MMLNMMMRGIGGKAKWQNINGDQNGAAAVQ